MSKEWNMKNAEYERIKKEVLTKYSEILLEKLIVEENGLSHYEDNGPQFRARISQARVDALRFAIGQLNLNIGEDEITAYRKEYEVDGKIILQFRKM